MIVLQRKPLALDNCPHRPKRSTFVSTFIEYMQNSQIHGYKIIVSPNRPYVERILWSVLSCVGIGFTIWVVVWAYLDLLTQPTVTSQSTNQMSVQDVDFPAVVFCLENRISRRSMMNFSEFVFNATQELDLNLGQNVDEVFSNLLVLGKMYDLRTDEEDFYLFDRVHTVLSKIYGEMAYPMQEILSSLAPKCEDMLKRCRWLGRMVDCKNLFSVRRTYTGNCCAFNYLRPWASEIRKQNQYNHSVTLHEAARVYRHGTGFGLDVLIDQQFDDYAFSVHSNMGTRIMVFNTQNFPDQTSGAIKEKFIGAGEEMFLLLTARPHFGDDEMRKYPPSARKCVFDNEIRLIYENFYTLSECLLVCRLEHIRRFCGCVLPQYSGFYANTTQCKLDDMPCLWRWNLKWFNFEPLAGNSNNMKEDTNQMDSHCPECIPRCAFVRYGLESSTTYMPGDAFNNHRTNTEFTSGINAQNHSIVHINFARHKVPQFEQNTQLTWYEQLASFGGIASLTLGASFISVVELIYFWTGRFGSKILRRITARKPKEVYVGFHP